MAFAIAQAQEWLVKEDTDQTLERNLCVVLSFLCVNFLSTESIGNAHRPMLYIKSIRKKTGLNINQPKGTRKPSVWKQWQC